MQRIERVIVQWKSPDDDRMDSPGAPSQQPSQQRMTVPARAQCIESWPADKVERRPIKALIPAARNARTHTDAQVDQIAASNKEWGWTMPVLVTDEGTIIAGHGRVRAAQKLGLKDVPVMVATRWTKAQIQAYALADNKLTLNAGWDEALLAIEIGELQEIGFDIGLIGFSDAEIAGLAVGEMTGLTEPDEVPEAPAEPVSRPGDLWVLRPASAALRRQHRSRGCDSRVVGVDPKTLRKHYRDELDGRDEGQRAGRGLPIHRGTQRQTSRRRSSGSRRGPAGARRRPSCGTPARSVAEKNCANTRTRS